MIGKLVTKVFGTKHERELKRIQPLIEQVNGLESDVSPLTDDELRGRTLSTLERMTGRTVRLTTRVQPDLLGGAVTRVGSQVYDGSLRTQLAQLRKRMSHE